MARQIFGPILAGRSATDQSVTGRYRFQKYVGTSSTIDGVPNVTPATVAGEECMGVLIEKPKALEVASIQTYDVCKVEAGVALPTVGTKVMTDASGRAIVATSTNRALGETLEIVTALGQIVTVRLYPVHPIV